MIAGAWICLVAPLVGAIAITLAGTRISRRSAAWLSTLSVFVAFAGAGFAVGWRLLILNGTADITSAAFLPLGLLAAFCLIAACETRSRADVPSATGPPRCDSACRRQSAASRP